MRAVIAYLPQVVAGADLLSSAGLDIAHAGAAVAVRTTPGLGAVIEASTAVVLISIEVSAPAAIGCRSGHRLQALEKGDLRFQRARQVIVRGTVSVKEIEDRRVELTRFRGHQPNGEYGVQHGRGEAA